MKILNWLLIVGMVLCLGGYATAQDAPPDDPQAAATVIYDFFLNGQAYDAWLNLYLCREYRYPHIQWEAIIAARGDATFSLEGVDFTVTEVDEDIAYISIEGLPTPNSPSGQVPAVILPSEVMLVNQDGWRLCPRGEVGSIISAADLALTEAESAFEIAVQFYAAFYTAQLEQIALLSCTEKREALQQAALDNYIQGFEILPSEWQLGFIPEGYDLTINTAGTLQAFSFQRNAPIVLDDRGDFFGARLVRENGWKFCTHYREGETAILAFARAYFGDPENPDEVPYYTCREQQENLRQAANRYAFEIQSINVPEDLFVDEDASDDLAIARNLPGLIAISTRGEYASAGSEFGMTAALVREANQWRWCQLPLFMVEEGAE